MPRIELTTRINASRELVFDLSRSIDLHLISTSRTNEMVIAGKSSGLMDLGDSVTWRARHFGIYQELSSKITAFDRPYSFTDEMVEGIFKRFKHEHHFEELNGETIMKDVFDYTSPLGILGKLADALFLKSYMTEFLFQRNNVIKAHAEDGNTNSILPTSVQ